MKKRKLRVFRTMIFALVMFICLIAAVNWVMDFALNSDKGEEDRTPLVSEQVLDYEPLVARYAKEKGITDYTDVIMAIMMQESGGRGKDPMQSSESSCGKPGCIKNPEQSVKAGVAHFANMLNEANGDLELAVQSYNFGRGFIAFAKQEAGGYTQEAAIDFSKEMYAKVKDKEKYRCIRPDSKKFDACYGDIYYVKSVMAYRPAFATDS